MEVVVLENKLKFKRVFFSLLRILQPRLRVLAALLVVRRVLLVVLFMLIMFLVALLLVRLLLVGFFLWGCASSRSRFPDHHRRRLGLRLSFFCRRVVVRSRRLRALRVVVLLGLPRRRGVATLRTRRTRWNRDNAPSAAGLAHATPVSVSLPNISSEVRQLASGQLRRSRPSTDLDVQV